MGGSGERAVRPGTGGYPDDPLNSPSGSPTAGYPTVGGSPQQGDTGRYSSGGHATGGYSSGGYSTGGYSTGGASESGRYSSGGQATGGYPQSGGYPQAPRTSGAGESGAYGSGAYGRDSGRSATGGYATGGYSSGGYSSGGYESGGYESGGYESGSRRSDGGEYTRASRDSYGPRDSYASRESSGRGGGYRSGTGSHRIVREEREGRRWGIVLAGAVVGIAACVLAVFVVMSGTGTDGGSGTGQIVGSGASESASAGTAEFAGVPDACTIVGSDLVEKLAPNSERNVGDTYQGNDRQTQCVWGIYTGDKKRQLTIELRAIEAAGGQTATATAQRTFESERKVDEAGDQLLEGQELADKRRLEGVGDEGYVVYTVDDPHGTGEAIANVRFVNVLVTIHYAGSEGKDPLSYDAAGDGAVEVVEAVLAKLKES
ncbi:hypothetical protein [Actinomadura algeriensis]|uniref:DUF3558 domain-containing protein n=1 Tax=Actinomadura algeriensis TaxID=1679523 RepID=A0ABR9JLP6_9ACTN|nr:hypothetical protein [Actinomadura algeriensis]MBE1531482.1 hypothetical protein [Actinomadura algeriensis]